MTLETCHETQYMGPGRDWAACTLSCTLSAGHQLPHKDPTHGLWETRGAVTTVDNRGTAAKI